MRWRRLLPTFAIFFLSMSAACTLLLDRSREQCSSDSDCAALSAGAVCRDSLCVSGADAAIDAMSSGDSGAPLADGGGPTDATSYGQDGCVVVTPGPATTNDELANACTRAECVPFDNCALLGVCDGGLLGAFPPDAASPPAPPGPDSGAAQLCTNLAASAGTKLIYATGSSNFPPFLKALAPILFGEGYSVVWQTSNSCAGVDAIMNDYSGATAPILDPDKTVLRERAGRITEFYGQTGISTPCLISGTVPVDVGESDIYAQTCASTLKYDPTTPTIRNSVGEYLGPTMAMSFIVPAASAQDAISAEAAQAVFGRGGVPDSTKLPYDDPLQFFTRSSSTATNQIMSRAIFVDPKSWWGIDERSAQNMADAMKQVPTNLASKTIGIISTDFAETERGNIKALAFQAKGQTCAFWPDSTRLSSDKANVRDGHYPIWGPIHFFARVAGGITTSEAAGAFVSRFSVPKPDLSLVKGLIDAHTVPACAMHVTRDVEMGPIKPYAPLSSCDCLFDRLTKGTTECKVCSSPQDCPTQAPACNYGFCEPR
jgi:hypothetical protein